MNHCQDDFVSPSTTATANEYNPPSTSTYVAISKHPLYFSYKCVPSMLRIGRQYGKLSMDSLKAQNTWRNIRLDIWSKYVAVTVPGLLDFSASKYW